MQMQQTVKRLRQTYVLHGTPHMRWMHSGYARWFGPSMHGEAEGVPPF